MASGSADNTVRLWDLAGTREIARLEGHSGAVSSVAFSPDGSRLASGSDDETVRLWIAAAETVPVLGPQSSQASDSVRYVGFDPDGHMLAVGRYDGIVQLWDAMMTELRAEMRGHSDWVFAVDFAPNGESLATSGQDGTVRLWDVPRAVQFCDFGRPWARRRSRLRALV